MTEINLKDFIKEAITQITDGIVAAQNENTDKGCIINPKMIQTIGTMGSVSYMLDQSGNNLGTTTILNFDLHIAGSDKNDGAGTLKVISGFLNVTGSLGKSENNSVSNRLTFSIPVSFPYNK